MSFLLCDLMEQHLLTHYRKENGVYCVDVAVNDLKDIFSEHDPSFLHERDLNTSLAKYITDQLIIFPVHVPARIVFHLPKKFKNIEEDIYKAFRHHFEFEYLDSQIHMKRRLRKAKHIFFFALLIFIVLMVGSFVLESYFSYSWIAKLIGQGLFIGAWVAMWHPIELLLYDWLPLYEDEKMYKRLIEMEVKFYYK